MVPSPLFCCFLSPEISFFFSPKGNENFLSFAKNAKWGLDLYEYLVAPTINSDLQVESWMNGANPLPSYCTSQNASYAYNVRNVREILLGDMDYTETKDHSKWCVSEVGQWTCVGDINRQVFFFFFLFSFFFFIYFFVFNFF